MSDWMIDCTGGQIGPDQMLALMKCSVRTEIGVDTLRIYVGGTDQNGKEFTVGAVVPRGCDLRAVDVLAKNLTRIIQDAAAKTLKPEGGDRS